jgi:precorrin-2/cobalt-factor-2 C20-methyltransferase
MKIGKRLPMVLEVLRDLGISGQCALASRLGLPGELLYPDVSTLSGDSAPGYLSTMLIRRVARERRHV